MGFVNEYAGVDVDKEPRGQPIRAQVVLELHEHDDDALAGVQVVAVVRDRWVAAVHRGHRTPGPRFSIAIRVHRGTAVRRHGHRSTPVLSHGTTGRQAAVVIGVIGSDGRG